MTLAEIALQRFYNQQFAYSTFQAASELISWLGAVQAQEYAQTKWALGLRLPHLVDQDIERDFAAGKILRTHVMRPTWHFVSAEDIRWLLMLTAPRVHQANAFMYRKLELNQSIFDRSNGLIVRALTGGKHLTRDAINTELQNNNMLAKGDRLSYIMMAAELDGLVCSGPRQGNQFTYALLDERVPETASISRDEALAELTRRFFSSRGPATVYDFATWSGLMLADCRRGLNLVGSSLESITVDQIDYFASDNTLAGKPPTDEIHLLHLYDEWLMGYRDRSATLVLKNSLFPGSVLQLENVIMSGGQIIGTWKRKAGNKSITIEARFFDKLNERQRNALDQALLRFERFAGVPVVCIECL